MERKRKTTLDNVDIRLNLVERAKVCKLRSRLDSNTSRYSFERGSDVHYTEILSDESVEMRREREKRREKSK